MIELPIPEKFRLELLSLIKEWDGGCFFEAVYDFGELRTLSIGKGPLTPLLLPTCISVFMVWKFAGETSELYAYYWDILWWKPLPRPSGEPATIVVPFWLWELVFILLLSLKSDCIGLLFDNENARFLELFIIGDWLILLLYLINA